MTDELFKEEKGKEEKVAKTKENIPATFNTSASPGTEQIGSEDIQLGRYRLLQALSGEVENGQSKPGLIKESLSGQEFEVLEIIPLALFKSRVLFDEENRKGGPLCRSMDSDLKHGSNSPDPASNNECIKCDFSKRFPPACSLVYNYPCIRPDQVGKEPLPSLLSIMKASTAVAQKINAFIVNKFPRPPMWNYVWEISGRKRDFKKGTAYVLEAKMKREASEEERTWAKAIYDSGLAGKRIEPQWEEGDGSE